MYICNVRINKQNNNKLINKIMMNQVNNSQSTAAVNSANVSNVINSNNYFSIIRRVDGSYRSVPTTDCQNLWDNIFEILKMKGNESIITVNRDDFYMSVNIGRNMLGTYSLYGRFSNGTGDYKYVQVVTDVKVWRGKNINLIAHAILEFIEESYNEYIKAAGVNAVAEVSEAPNLEQAPTLEETPMLEQDDITEDGYSVAGLKYVAENLENIDIKGTICYFMGDLFDDPYTMEQITRGGCINEEKFVDALWDIVWNEYLCGMTDEALESETRYYTNFDALCSTLCSNIAAYDEVMRVVKKNANDYYGAQGFSWDLFTEETMCTLMENDDLVGMLRKSLFAEVGCSDLLVYDDCLYVWYNNESCETSIVTAA